MESLFSIPRDSALWGWGVLLMAALGTYIWRGLGVMFSGKLDTDGAFFRWLTCVTYAMVASLVIRIIVLPLGLLAQTPLILRLLAAGVAVGIMISGKNRLVPALVTGTALTMVFGWFWG
jgi:branched-subunit amino acid transport protein